MQPTTPSVTPLHPSVTSSVQQLTPPGVFPGASFSPPAAEIPDVERLHPPGQDVHPGIGGGRWRRLVANRRTRTTQGRALQVPGPDPGTQAAGLLEYTDTDVAGVLINVSCCEHAQFRDQLLTKADVCNVEFARAWEASR